MYISGPFWMMYVGRFCILYLTVTSTAELLSHARLHAVQSLTSAAYTGTGTLPMTEDPRDVDFYWWLIYKETACAEIFIETLQKRKALA
jgi:hypothetical protein